MRLPSGFVPSSQFSQPARHGLWFLFRGRELLVSATAELPRLLAPAALKLEATRSQFLGELEGVACFSAELALDSEPPAGMAFVDLRALYGRMSLELLSLAGHAVQVMDWDRSHRFCGACGAATEP